MWDGHFACADCGRLYERAALPQACSCGTSFEAAHDKSLAGSIRLACDKTLKIKRICKKCYKHFMKHGGRLPVEQRKPN